MQSSGRRSWMQKGTIKKFAWDRGESKAFLQALVQFCSSIVAASIGTQCDALHEVHWVHRALDGKQMGCQE